MNQSNVFRPRVIATHVILTAYGHWLPNDPRGSMSQQAHAPNIAALGPVHCGRKTVQPPKQVLKQFYRKAGDAVYFGKLWFDAPHRTAIARTLESVIRAESLTCYACAVLNNHVHILIRRHRLKAQQVSLMLRKQARDLLCEEGLAPQGHPVFSADCCHFFKDTPQAMHACVQYINDNFTKHRIAPTPYLFVQAYDGWQ